MKTSSLHIKSIMLFLFLIESVLATAQFHINPGSAITIKNGTTFFADTDLTIVSDSLSSGYLVDQTMNNGVVINGNITVERYIDPNGWHNISAPLSNAHSNVFTGNDLIFYYDETIVQNNWNFGWVWHEGNLEIMKGYDVRMLNSPLTVQYFSSNPTHLNTGQYNINVTNTNVPDGEIPEHKGWNLIGNPYPSPVDWLAEEGWIKSSINNAKYIWDPSAEVYTIFIGGPEPIGLNGGTRFIPSNQGFWVQAFQNGNIQLDNRTRVGQTPLTPDFYKSKKPSYPMLSIVVNGNGYSDETIIRFIEGTYEGFDMNYDALKLLSYGENAPQIASVWENKLFGINTFEAETETGGIAIPLFFASKRRGEYSLVLSESSNLNNLTPIFLRDHKLNHFTLIDIDLAYTFDHDPADASARFSILIKPTLHQQLGDDSRFGAYSHGGLVYITDFLEKETKMQIRIFNLLGQCVWSAPVTINKSYIFSPDLNSGAFIVVVENSEVFFKQKILFNK